MNPNKVTDLNVPAPRHGGFDIEDVRPSRSAIQSEPDVKIDLEAEKVRSHIAEGDEFVGNLNCSAGVRISGIVRGSVTCKTGAVVLEQSGHVTGSIQGQEKVFINGRVGEEGGDNSGKINTPGLIILMTHAVVNADIEYGKMATYGDMVLNGNSRKIQPTP